MIWNFRKMILNFDPQIDYLQSLIMYFILVQVFNDVLQFKKHYGVNNVVTITTIVTTIVIAIIVVLKVNKYNTI